MNNWIDAKKEMPKAGEFVLIFTFCEMFAGYFADRYDGVDYETYVSTYEPDDEDDKPVCYEDYEFDRYYIDGVFCRGCMHAEWRYVDKWMPIPEV